MPCNFEVNLITCLGVIALFSSCFSSPDPKGHVRYCHHLASVVHPLTFSYFNLSLLERCSQSNFNAHTLIKRITQSNWPGFVNYNYKENGTIGVRLSNLTRGTITIPQKAIICEVQPVTIETQSTPNSDENIKLLEEVDITKSDLNKEHV
jgi:hypothetical protein